MRRLLAVSLLLAGCGEGLLASLDETDGTVVLDSGPDVFVGGDEDAGTADALPPDGSSIPGVAPHPVVLHPAVAIHVRSGAQATTSYADAERLWIDQDVDGEVAQGYLRFDVSEVGEIARATLHLFINDGSKDSLDVNALVESTIDATMLWDTRPAEEGTLVKSLEATTKDRWVAIDVTSLVHPGTALTLALLPRSGDGVGVVAGKPTHRPKLVLEIGAELPPNAIEAEADTFVRAGDTADQRYDDLPYVDVDGDAEGAEKQAFMRFRIGDVPAFERAALRLYLLDGSGNGATVVKIEDDAFGENLTWNTKPATDGAGVGAISATTRGWVELDVTAHVKPAATLSLALLPASGDGIRIASRERPYYRPHLLLIRGDATCGDGQCDTGETCESCAEDCGGACAKGCLMGELLPMAGDMHAHTSYSDGEGTPAQAFKHARDRIDFLILTDHHKSLTSTEWSNCRSAANDADTPGSFIAACGWEIRLGGTECIGHSNVLFATSLSALPYVSDYATYYTKLAACSGCLAQVNHPMSDRFLWKSYAFQAKAVEELALQEFNGGGTVAEKIAKYAAGLDAGWLLAPTWNSDTHSANWGERAVRSGFWVTERSRAALKEAMSGRRSFASSDADARIRLRSAGCWSGTTLPAESLAVVEVLATDPKEGFDRIVLVGKGNKALKTFPCGEQQVCGGTAQVQVAEATYAFAYAVQKDGGHLISSPVWLVP